MKNRMTGQQSLHAAILAALGIAALGVLPSTAGAQQGASPQVGGLEEIVVTARKREESVQDVPVTVTAITSAMVDRYDLTSLERIAASMPQLNIGRASNGSGAQITLRGIGSQSTSIGLEQSTAIIVDGVYYGQGRVINEAFFDLERVEILKGPQALYFGKNATAGVVNIATASPTRDWQSMARASYEFNAREPLLEGFISGPLSDTVSFRVAARASKMYGDLFENIAVPTPLTTLDIGNGFAPTTRMQNPSEGPFPGTDNRTVRATLKWEPTDRLTMSLKAGFNIAKDDSNAGNYVAAVCAKPDGTAQTNPLVRCAKNFKIHQPAAPAGFFGPGGIPGTRDDGQPYDTYRSWTTTGTLDYDLGGVSFTSVNNYNWNRNKWSLGANIESPVSYVMSTENTSFWAFSSENRLQTRFDGPMNVMLGAYYQKSKRKFLQYGNFAPLTDSTAGPELENLANLRRSATDGETLAVFGQLTWELASKLELSAGVRYTHETKDSFLIQPYVISALRSLFPQYDPADPSTRVDAKQTFNNWSPEATLRYKPTEDVMLYAAYKTAYKSGGFSNSAFLVAGAPVSNVAFDPEKVDGFEAGVKTTLLNNQLRLNLSAYAYSFNNLQVDFFDSITFQFITTNAGKATTKGVEAEFEFAPQELAGLNLRGSLNYNRARYKEYIAPCYGGQSIAAGCNTTFLGGLGQDLSGKPTAMAPKLTASLGVNFETPVGANLQFGISADARYSGSYLASSFGEPLSRNGKYVNIDASIRIGTADDRWDLALIARNLTNNWRMNGVLDVPNSGTGTGTANAVPADILGLADNPRTVRLQLTWRN